MGRISAFPSDRQCSPEDKTMISSILRRTPRMIVSCGFCLAILLSGVLGDTRGGGQPNTSSLDAGGTPPSSGETPEQARVRLLAEILDHELRDQGQYGNYPALHAFVAM